VKMRFLAGIAIGTARHYDAPLRFGRVNLEHSSNFPNQQMPFHLTTLSC